MLRRLTALAALALLAGLVWLRSTYGGGQPYPDLTTEPLLAAEALEVVVAHDQPIGNVAVSAGGRVFFTVHPESRSPGPKLFEWRDGRAEPFPAAERQRGLLATPLGVVIDHRGRLWTVDHGLHGLRTPRLVAFDLATGATVHDNRFDDATAPAGSTLQDLQVDPASGAVYLADVGFFSRRPALVVYQPETGAARRVLERHPSVAAQPWLIRNPARTMEFFGLVELRVGVDGLAVARDGTWLAYGAMSHDTLYRVPTAALRDPALGPEALTLAVEAIGRKPLSDGLSTDRAGNVLITDVEHGAVLRMAPDGRLETLVRTDRLRWPDALSYGPDGWLYVADSALADVMLRSRRHIRRSGPYFVFRFRPGTDGAPGQ